MDEMPDLPYTEPNRALIAKFQLEGVLATAATDYTAGRWELRAHPDLVSRLIELAPVRSLYSVYGLPCLAAGRAEHAVAAVVAGGTDTLLIRLPAPPTPIELERGVDGLGAAQGWYAATAWQNTVRLKGLVEDAYAFAGDMAARLTDQANLSTPTSAPSAL